MSFDAFPHDAWPTVCDAFARPWPEALAAHDLRWYAAEYAVRGKRLPDVRALAERWGWTRTRTFDLIHGSPDGKGGRRPARWVDEARPWGWGPDKLRTSSGQAPDTGDGQTPKIHETPDTLRTDSGQAPDSRARSSSAPNTDHPTPETPCSPTPATAGSDAAPGHGEETTPPATPPPPQKQADAADRLYAVYQRLQPSRSPTPTPDARKAMRRILAEAGGQERAERYLVWVHQSEDQWARRLRGREPWPDGSTKRRMSPEELARSLGGRLDEADAWHERGRTTADARAAPGPANVHPLELLRQRLSQATP